MFPHPLIIFETQKYYENEPKFIGVYSSNNLSEIKGGANIKNLGEYESIGTHWIALYVDDNNLTYFDSFGDEHIPKEIRTFIGNENIITNIYGIQAFDLMCGYFCIGLTNFVLKVKVY